MKFLSKKWRQEKRQREEQIYTLFDKHLRLFMVWKDMLYLIKKMITITGSEPDEVSEKATAAMAKLYELFSYDKQDALYPGHVKRLHSLEKAPVMEINQHEEGNATKVIATITYEQYMLKPGFTEEEFYAALEASDKATEEYERYRKECLAFGMNDF